MTCGKRSVEGKENRSQRCSEFTPNISSISSTISKEVWSSSRRLPKWKQTLITARSSISITHQK